MVGIDRRLLQNLDWPLVGATVGLVTLSASTLATVQVGRAGGGVALRQLAWFCVGLFALTIVASIDYRRLVQMAPLFYVAGLAALILLEKVWRYGAGLGRAFGVALIVLAFFVPWNPAIVPGLHVDEDAPAMQMETEDGTLPTPADDATRMDDGAAPTQEMPAPAAVEPAMEMDPAIDP